jgi:hypothetical protein
MHLRHNNLRGFPASIFPAKFIEGKRVPCQILVRIENIDNRVTSGQASESMIAALFPLVSFLKSGLKNRTELALENLALRQQLTILERNQPHPRLLRTARLFWAYLSSVWQRWRKSLIVVKPETVVRWHRKGFALYWSLLSKWHRGAHGKILSVNGSLAPYAGIA